MYVEYVPCIRSFNKYEIYTHKKKKNNIVGRNCLPIVVVIGPKWYQNPRSP